MFSVKFLIAFFKIFLFMSVCVCHICIGDCGSQKRMQDALELELQVVMRSSDWVRMNSGLLQVLLGGEPFLQSFNSTLEKELISLTGHLICHARRGADSSSLGFLTCFQVASHPSKPELFSLEWYGSSFFLFQQFY